MREIGSWVLAHWSLCAFVLAAFVQFTPGIKFSPLQWLGGLFLGSVKSELRELRVAIDENEKDWIRWEVLDFANSCRNGRRHTRDEYQHIITLHDKYKALLEKTHDSNGVFDAEYDYILELYRQRQERNDFL